MQVDTQTKVSGEDSFAKVVEVNHHDTGVDILLNKNILMVKKADQARVDARKVDLRADGVAFPGGATPIRWGWKGVLVVNTEESYIIILDDDDHLTFYLALEEGNHLIAVAEKAGWHVC